LNKRPWHSKYQYRPNNNKSYQDNKFRIGPPNIQKGSSSRSPHQNNYQKSYSYKPLVYSYCGKSNHHQRNCRKYIFDEKYGINCHNFHSNSILIRKNYYMF
jgi:hypothetical protein